jgi:hypothetical protein
VLSAALIEIVSRPIRATAETAVGLLVRIQLAPAVNRTNFRIAPLTGPLPPRQLLLFLTSKFGFCRLRLTESATVIGRM